MNDEMRNVLKYILDNHGTDIFSNMNRINAILLDLAADMPRERILVRSFVEADGFRTLKNAGETYPVVASRLINTLTDMFSMEREAAAWVTKLCASALGYDVADFYLTGYTEEKVTDSRNRRQTLKRSAKISCPL